MKYNETLLFIEYVKTLTDDEEILKQSLHKFKMPDMLDDYNVYVNLIETIIILENKGSDETVMKIHPVDMESMIDALKDIKNHIKDID